jgi:hypothetical protein
MTGKQFTETVHRLLSEETRPVFLAALVIGGLSVGWAAGSVAAGESLGAQLWVVAVLTGVGTTVAALLGNDDG